MTRLKTAKIQVNRAPLTDMWKQASQSLAEQAAQTQPPSAAPKTAAPPTPAASGKK
jgi:hypothetical protein